MPLHLVHNVYKHTRKCNGNNYTEIRQRCLSDTKDVEDPPYGALLRATSYGDRGQEGCPWVRRDQKTEGRPSQVEIPVTVATMGQTVSA